MSDDDDDVPGNPIEAPPPSTTPVWHRDRTFELSVDETRKTDDFVTEAGTYYVDAQLDAGSRTGVWIGLYAAENGVGGGYVDLTIHPHRRVSVGTGVRG